MLEGFLLLLLVVPPLALLVRSLAQFTVEWFRGWPLDSEAAPVPAAQAPAHDPECPACRQPLAAKARQCPHCGLDFEDAPLLVPGRRRLIRF